LSGMPAVWTDRAPEYDALVSLLDEIDEADATVWSGSAMHGAVKDILLKSLVAEPYWLEGFYRLAQYAEECSTQFSSHELASLAEPFRRYLSSSFSEDLHNAGGQSELEDLGSELQTASEWLGVSVDYAQEELAEKLQELEDRAGARGESVRDWTAASPGNEMHGEQEIRRLFDELSES